MRKRRRKEKKSIPLILWRKKGGEKVRAARPGCEVRGCWAFEETKEPTIPDGHSHQAKDDGPDHKVTIMITILWLVFAHAYA